MTTEVNVESIDALIGRSDALRQYSLSKTHSTRRHYGQKTKKTRKDQITSNLEEINSEHDWSIVGWTDSNPTIKKPPVDTSTTTSVMKTTSKLEVKKSKIEDHKSEIPSQTKEVEDDEIQTLPITIKRILESHTSHSFKCNLSDHELRVWDDNLSQIPILRNDVNELSLSGQKITVMSVKSQHLDKQH